MSLHCQKNSAMAKNSDKNSAAKMAKNGLKWPFLGVFRGFLEVFYCTALFHCFFLYIYFKINNTYMKKLIF